MSIGRFLLIKKSKVYLSSWIRESQPVCHCQQFPPTWRLHLLKPSVQSLGTQSPVRRAGTVNTLLNIEHPWCHNIFSKNTIKKEKEVSENIYLRKTQYAQAGGVLYFIQIQIQLISLKTSFLNFKYIISSNKIKLNIYQTIFNVDLQDWQSSVQTGAILNRK